MARVLHAEATNDRLAIVLDAGRGQVYAATFLPTIAGLQVAAPTRLVSAEDWLASLEPGVLVAGPALAELSQRLPPHARPAPPEWWFPGARGVAMAAMERAGRGEHDDPFTLVPRYLRPSAAEEKSRAGNV